MSSQGIEERHNQNSILKEDETTLSQKENQRRIHTQLTNEIVEGQLPKYVVVDEEYLAPEDNQEKDRGEEKHSYIMLIKWNEEIRLLKKPES